MSQNPKLVLGGKKKVSEIGYNANPVMLQQLREMGFAEDISRRALEVTKNQGVGPALTWIDENREKFIFERLEEDKEKKTEEVVEDRNQFGLPKREIDPTLETEVRIGNRLKGDTTQDKLEFEKKRLHALAEEKKKERREQKRALKELRRKMRREKEERMRKNAGESPTKKQKKPDVEVKKIESVPKSETNCDVQIRLNNGKALRYAGKSTDSLKSLQKLVCEKSDLEEGSFEFLVPFPRRAFKIEEFEKLTLGEAQLAPRGSVNVILIEQKGKMKKGEGYITPPNHNPFPGPMPGPFPGPFPGPMPAPVVPGPAPVVPGHTTGGGKKDPEEEPEEVSEKNEDLLQRKWYLSKESPNEGKISVYRNENNREEKDDADTFNFLESGILSRTLKDDTKTGKWKLIETENRPILDISIDKSRYEILSLTSKILIIKKIIKN